MPENLSGKFLGKTFKTSSMKENRSWTTSGLPTWQGYLKITQNSTNIVVGTVHLEDVHTKIMAFSPYDLASLKRLLKNFDMRTLEWDEDTPIEGEL